MTTTNFMQLALKEATKAYHKNEIPIGAIIVINNKIIAKGHNQTELLKDATAHAEIIAITQASHILQSKYLFDATLFCTIEPCVMCYGAIINAKIKHLCFGAKEPKTGFTNFINPTKHLHVEPGPLEKECSELMVKFFENRRQ